MIGICFTTLLHLFYGEFSCEFLEYRFSIKNLLGEWKQLIKLRKKVMRMIYTAVQSIARFTSRV